MRKANSILVFLFTIIWYSASVAAQKMPNEIEKKMTEQSTRQVCGDVQYLECASLEKDNCISAMSFAMGECDFSPVWNAFRERDKSGLKILPNKEHDIYSSCVRDMFYGELRKSAEVLDKCALEQHGRFVEFLKSQ